MIDRRSAQGDYLEAAVLAAIDDHDVLVGLAAQRRNGLLDRRHLDGWTGGREHPDPHSGLDECIPEFGTVAADQDDFAHGDLGGLRGRGTILSSDGEVIPRHRSGRLARWQPSRVYVKRKRKLGDLCNGCPYTSR